MGTWELKISRRCCQKLIDVLLKVEAYIVMDNLGMMPVSTISSITLLIELDVKDMGVL
ncbi:hypothetical protein WN944_010046 [Citrus x changshan-huyou]|uniref:Uncharacterized protein n=1 Tax=Citrus x changshan-huyou TaxID=2935761 RepID=A0AAP0MSW0_9ROSI